MNIMRKSKIMNLAALQIFAMAIGVAFALNDHPFVFRGTYSNGGYNPGPVPFDNAWVAGFFGASNPEELVPPDGIHMPSHLSCPDFVEVHEYDGGGDAKTEPLLFHRLGKAAREIVDASKSDVVLFRNLSSRIRSAKEFAAFFGGCLDGPGGWQSMDYVPFNSGRATVDGVDLVTPFPPEFALKSHNEMAYNPRSANLIAFYCLEKAEKGGETILLRNSDLTDAVSKSIQQFVKDHGGVMYERKYLDESNMPEQNNVMGPPRLSWQEKTESNNREEARKFFTDIGFLEEDVYFDDSGTLNVRNVHSGFIVSPSNDKSDTGVCNDEDTKQLWFNVLYLGVFKLADGTAMPKPMLKQLNWEEWKAAHVLQLEPGDWIVIRNRRVQHGRLPFVNSAERERKILTVYTA